MSSSISILGLVEDEKLGFGEIVHGEVGANVGLAVGLVMRLSIFK